MKNNYIINIGRQLGCGGREIGLKLSSRLGIPFYDKELIRIASKESGLKEEVFEKADEKRHFSLFGGLLGLRGSATNEIYLNYYLTDETLFKIQSDVIRSLAEKQSCLFVGRCADYILKENPRCLNVFICGDLDDRIKRIAEIQHLPENKAWGVAESYYLCINSSVLGIDETVSFISLFAEKRFVLK